MAVKATVDPELNLLASVVQADTFGLALMRGLRPSYFGDRAYGEAWAMFQEHYQKYGVVPNIETIAESYPTLREYLVKARPVEPPQFYADRVIENYVRHGSAEALLKVLPELENNPEETLGRVRQIVGQFDLIQKQTPILNLENTARERYDLYKSEDVYGVKYVWGTLDQATLGAQKGELIGLFARPGQGKTWHLLNQAHYAWRADDKRVLLITTEVPPPQMLMRLDALMLHCDYNAFKRRNLTTQQEQNYRALLENHPRREDFIIVPGMGLTPAALSVLIEQIKPDMVFIDGIYMLDADENVREDWAKVRKIMRALKERITLRYGIPIMYTSQFGKSVATAFGAKKKNGVEGGADDVGYGDAFAHYSDLMLSLFRDQDDITNNMASIRIIKGRETQDGVMWKVKFDFRDMSFEETAPIEPAPDDEPDSAAW